MQRPFWDTLHRYAHKILLYSGELGALKKYYSFEGGKKNFFDLNFARSMATQFTFRAKFTRGSVIKIGEKFDTGNLRGHQMVENMSEDRRLRVPQLRLVIAVCSSIIHERGKKKGEKRMMWWKETMKAVVFVSTRSRR